MNIGKSIKVMFTDFISVHTIFGKSVCSGFFPVCTDFKLGVHKFSFYWSVKRLRGLTTEQKGKSDKMEPSFQKSITFDRLGRF